MTKYTMYCVLYLYLFFLRIYQSYTAERATALVAISVHLGLPLISPTLSPSYDVSLGKGTITFDYIGNFAFQIEYESSLPFLCRWENVEEVSL